MMMVMMMVMIMMMMVSDDVDCVLFHSLHLVKLTAKGVPTKRGLIILSK